MKCLVVGAGAQGAPASAILARDADVAEVVLADYDREHADRVKAKIAADSRADAGKIATAQVDARDVDAVTGLARDCDVILNFVHMDFSKGIRAAALAAGVHYVDTASDLQSQRDLAFEHRIADDAAFRAAGLAGVMGSGETPGVTNALARYAADMLDEVDDLIIRFGYGFFSGDPGVVYPFDPGWCPDVALQDFNDKACVFTAGKPTMQGPFANPETYRFEEPLGEILVCSHSHDESYTLPFFIGKGIKECDFKYPVDQAAGTLVAMGFGDPGKVIELSDGTRVRPFEVAMSLTPKPVEGFLLETEENLVGFPDWEAAAVVEASGRSAGCPKRVRVTRKHVDNLENRRQRVEKLGTINALVAAPAVAAARLIVKGEVRAGVMPVEALDPVAYLREVDAMTPLEIDVQVTSPLAL